MSLDEKIGKDRGIFQDVDVVRVLDLKESIQELKDEFGIKGLFGEERIEDKINKVFGRRLTGEERK